MKRTKITREEGYYKNWSRRIRKETLDILGGECAECGFNDYRALQIDHIDGGGSEERRLGGFTGSFHKNVMRSVKNEENKYQLLCANCNWIKRFENNEARGRLNVDK